MCPKELQIVWEPISNLAYTTNFCVLFCGLIFYTSDTCQLHGTQLIEEVFTFILQEKIPIEEVFEQLKCSREGLSADEGANRLQIFGPNKLEEKKVTISFFIFSIKERLLSQKIVMG